MSTTLSEGLEGFLRFCVPYIVIFALFILNLISFSPSLATRIEAPLILMFVYYWAVYRPSLIPPVFVFFIGILVDLLSGLPVGLNAFIFIFVRWVIIEQRNFLIGQPFIMVWFGYIVASFGALWLQWIMVCLLRFHWMPMIPVALMIVSGAFLFPLVSLVLNASHKVLPELRDQYSAVK